MYLLFQKEDSSDEDDIDAPDDGGAEVAKSQLDVRLQVRIEIGLTQTNSKHTYIHHAYMLRTVHAFMHTAHTCMHILYTHLHTYPYPYKIHIHVTSDMIIVHDGAHAVMHTYLYNVQYTLVAVK